VGRAPVCTTTGVVVARRACAPLPSVKVAVHSDVPPHPALPLIVRYVTAAVPAVAVPAVAVSTVASTATAAGAPSRSPAVLLVRAIALPPLLM
jgi:hypothetical protein